MKCTPSIIVNALGKKWSLAIIEEIYFADKIKFNELEKALKSVRPKILNERLKFFMTAGIIEKTHNYYKMTKAGKDFRNAVVLCVKEWDSSNTRCAEIPCSKCPAFRQ